MHQFIDIPVCEPPMVSQSYNWLWSDASALCHMLGLSCQPWEPAAVPCTHQACPCLMTFCCFLCPQFSSTRNLQGLFWPPLGLRFNQALSSHVGVPWPTHLWNHTAQSPPPGLPSSGSAFSPIALSWHNFYWLAGALPVPVPHNAPPGKCKPHTVGDFYLLFTARPSVSETVTGTE